MGYGMRRAPEQARDLAADVLLIAWRRIDEVPDDARPWLIAVARNRISNHRRDARRCALIGISPQAAAVRPRRARAASIQRPPSTTRIRAVARLRVRRIVPRCHHGWWSGP